MRIIKISVLLFTLLAVSACSRNKDSNNHQTGRDTAANTDLSYNTAEPATDGLDNHETEKSFFMPQGKPYSDDKWIAEILQEEKDIAVQENSGMGVHMNLLSYDLTVNRPQGALPYFSFDYNGGPIDANFTFMNPDENLINTIGLFILCDGIPVVYEIEDGNNISYMHEISLNTGEERTVPVKFTPDFTASLGRIDYIAIPYMNLIGRLDISLNLAFYFAETGNTADEESGSGFKQASPTFFRYNAEPGYFGGLQSRFFPIDFEYSNNIEPPPYMHTVNRKGHDEILLILSADTLNKYRTVVYYDYEPIIFADGKPYIDWEAADAGHRSMYIPIKLDGVDDGEDHCIFTSTIYLNDSRKYPLNNSLVFRIVNRP